MVPKKTERSKTVTNVELNIHSDGGAFSECSRCHSSVTPTDTSFPIIANIFCCAELSRDISDSLKIRKWNLVDSCSYVVWQAKQCMISPPDWSLGRLSLLRTQVFESSSRERIVSFPQKPAAPTMHNMKCMILLFNRCLFTLLPQPPLATTAAKTFSSQLLHFFSPHLPDNKQGRVFWWWKFSVFNLLCANAPSPPAYTSNFLQFPEAKYSCAETDSWASSCLLFLLP